MLDEVFGLFSQRSNVYIVFTLIVKFIVIVLVGNKFKIIKEFIGCVNFDSSVLGS